ncbi:putative J domain-containing protein [Pseudocercospora fuligena]|uniref:Putative J domain-containing protein n=1 Tax=Pseudocercospora fuligena TaxID=685502 RepID=A0A8H6VJG4_9PEZI|nr:putative J domain-containing protein [Pseudocercospora fuligena]
MPKRTRKEAESSDVEVDEAPTSINPYTVLGIEKDADQDTIKKAYRKAALKNHPDKVSPEEKESAHTKFQEIAFAFAILSDERRRKRYDTTGRTEESLDLEDDDFDWVDFFRTQFAEVVTVEKIQQFSNEYKGSEEEKEAVLDAYKKCKGDMTKIYEIVMLSDMLEDEERFRGIIDEAIEKGGVEEYKKYAQESESARQKRMDRARKQKEREAKEAEEVEEEIREVSKKKKTGKKSKEEDLGDLAAIIQKRQQDRAGGFFERLEEKYGGKGGMSEPPEEAFAANRKSKKGKK